MRGAELGRRPAVVQAGLLTARHHGRHCDHRRRATRLAVLTHGGGGAPLRREPPAAGSRAGVPAIAIPGYGDGPFCTGGYVGSARARRSSCSDGSPPSVLADGIRRAMDPAIRVATEGIGADPRPMMAWRERLRSSSDTSDDPRSLLCGTHLPAGLSDEMAVTGF